MPFPPSEPSPSQVPPSTITVTGCAFRQLAPKRVTVLIDFTTPLRATSREAMESAIAIRADVLALVDRRHPDADVRDSAVRIRTSHRAVETDVGHGRVERSQELEGYVGTGTVTVEDGAGEVAALLATGGAGEHQRVQAPRFSLSHETRGRVLREIDAEAIRDARDQADALAWAADTRVERVLAIGEGSASRGAAGVHSPYAGAVAQAAVLAGSAETFEEGLGEVRPEPISLQAFQQVRYLLVERS